MKLAGSSGRNRPDRFRSAAMTLVMSAASLPSPPSAENDGSAIGKGSMLPWVISISTSAAAGSGAITTKEARTNASPLAFRLVKTESFFSIPRMSTTAPLWTFELAGPVYPPSISLGSKLMMTSCQASYLEIGRLYGWQRMIARTALLEAAPNAGLPLEFMTSGWPET